MILACLASLPREISRSRCSRSWRRRRAWTGRRHPLSLREVVGVGDEGPHPEAADGTRRTPQGIEDGTDDGHGDEPQQGRKVELVLVGRSRDDDEASDDVGMIGRELYGHGPAEVVADDVGVGQAEVGAESV